MKGNIGMGKDPFLQPIEERYSSMSSVNISEESDIEKRKRKKRMQDVINKQKLDYY